MSDGTLTPRACDGMGAFPTGATVFDWCAITRSASSGPVPPPRKASTWSAVKWAAGCAAIRAPTTRRPAGGTRPYASTVGHSVGRAETSLTSWPTSARSSTVPEVCTRCCTPGSRAKRSFRNPATPPAHRKRRRSATATSTRCPQASRSPEPRRRRSPSWRWAASLTRRWRSIRRRGSSSRPRTPGPDRAAACTGSCRTTESTRTPVGPCRSSASWTRPTRRGSARRVPGGHVVRGGVDHHHRTEPTGKQRQRRLRGGLRRGRRAVQPVGRHLLRRSKHLLRLHQRRQREER